jgi:Histone-like transcription factor (CBF/NF-Y) and archaeal histone
VASEANEVCSNDNMKVVNPRHLKQALDNLGFRDYVAQLTQMEETYATAIQV